MKKIIKKLYLEIIAIVLLILAIVVGLISKKYVDVILYIALFAVPIFSIIKSIKE